ncbi:hypothetical protein BpHYR1_014561 [Brachionus plicatilis]|uniref:Uncharacterized protein n=1 Tax=Brachionus plicatilis TaxID=10195 RepID=A0A3M7PUP0_BRAPC|nr:hypothetical protein BpHYR1_014561 [Brachionus plicatilis]
MVQFFILYYYTSNKGATKYVALCCNGIYKNIALDPFNFGIKSSSLASPLNGVLTFCLLIEEIHRGPSRMALIL